MVSSHKTMSIFKRRWTHYPLIWNKRIILFRKLLSIPLIRLAAVTKISIRGVLTTQIINNSPSCNNPQTQTTSQTNSQTENHLKYLCQINHRKWLMEFSLMKNMIKVRVLARLLARRFNLKSLK